MESILSHLKSMPNEVGFSYHLRGCRSFGPVGPGSDSRHHDVTGPGSGTVAIVPTAGAGAGHGGLLSGCIEAGLQVWGEAAKGARDHRVVASGRGRTWIRIFSIKIVNIFLFLN